MGSRSVEAVAALLRVHTCREGDGVTVGVVGAINPATEPVLRGALDRALAHRPRHLIADVSGVEFCSVGGLGTLLLTATEAYRRGIRFVFAGMPAPMSHLWQIVYPHDPQPPPLRYATVAEAIAARTPGQAARADDRMSEPQSQPTAGAGNGGAPPDHDAQIEGLYRRDGKVCYSLACFLLDDAPAAEDLVCEIFSGAADGSAGPWTRTRLLATVHHAALRRLRSDPGRERRETDFAAPAGELRDGGAPATGDPSNDDSRIGTALGELDPLQRRVVLLAYHGDALDEIVARVGRPRAEVMTALHTAVRQLHSRLHDAGPIRDGHARSSGDRAMEFTRVRTEH